MHFSLSLVCETGGKCHVNSSCVNKQEPTQHLRLDLGRWRAFDLWTGSGRL